MPLAQIHSSVTSPYVWAAFVVFVLLSIGVDLGVYRRARGMSTRLALTWVAAWAGLALVFAGGVWRYLGVAKAEEFLSGYLLEESLSIDNLFVFVLVFTHFKTPRAEQHRVLVWGILGAMVLRATMILAGAALVSRFEWVLLVFAGLLLVSGLKLLFQGEDGDEDPSKSWVVRLARSVLPVTDDYRGHAFFVTEPPPPGAAPTARPQRKATLLLLVLVVIELSDVLFAVDSIPAIFGVTRDPFIVFTSNIFAILGLRSLFFVIEAAIQRLRYLKTGLALLLCFIAFKMALPFIYGAVAWAGAELPVVWPLALDEHGKVHLPTLLSLGAIVAILGTTAALSVLIKPRHRPPTSAEGAPTGGAAPTPSSTSDRIQVSTPNPPAQRAPDAPEGPPA
jgi:tellurite resistance protein TerC